MGLFDLMYARLYRVTYKTLERILILYNLSRPASGSGMDRQNMLSSPIIVFFMTMKYTTHRHMGQDRRYSREF